MHVVLPVMDSVDVSECTYKLFLQTFPIVNWVKIFTLRSHMIVVVRHQSSKLAKSNMVSSTTQYIVTR